MKKWCRYRVCEQMKMTVEKLDKINKDNSSYNKIQNEIECYLFK